MSELLVGPVAVRVFGSFESAYFMSYALRTVNAVIAPNLVADLGLGAEQLGALSSAYFLSFALMQLPLGVLLDRHGARRTEAALLLVAAAGCALFALASEFALLWLGRALIGLGVSACLMASMKAYRHWFAAERQGQLASWMLVAGTVGVLSTTVPVQRLAQLVGWRGVFGLAAALVLAAAAALYLLLPPTPEERAHRGPSWRSAMAGYTTVLRERYFWRMAQLGAVVQGGFIALQSLWIGPWFVTVLGYSPAQTAELLLLFNGVLLLAYLGIGQLSRIIERSGWSMIAVGATAACIVVASMLGIIGWRSSWSIVFWLAMGAASTVPVLMQIHLSMCFPVAFTGRAVTTYNLLVFVGAFAIQWGIGALIDAFTLLGSDTVGAYRGALGVLTGCELVALLVFLAWRVPRPRPD
ncbi:MAG: MFS transporter [Burkholderiales bacterium]|nr:MAG: MFS transporter [Burkholderiales bacterium]